MHAQLRVSCGLEPLLEPLFSEPRAARGSKRSNEERSPAGEAMKTVHAWSGESMRPLLICDVTVHQ